MFKSYLLLNILVPNIWGIFLTKFIYWYCLYILADKRYYKMLIYISWWTFADDVAALAEGKDNNLSGIIETRRSSAINVMVTGQPRKD